MTEKLTEREQMLTALLTSVAKTLKDLVECPECGGIGYTVGQGDIIHKSNIGNELVICLETEMCDCLKQAQSILNIIRRYEGNESEEHPIEIA